MLKQFPNVFIEEPPATLPPSDRLPHAIDLTPNHTIPPRRLYRQTPDELTETKRQIDEYLKNGHVRPSTSPFGAPVLLVKKKDGSMRMCVDYRALNDITIKNNFPIPRVDDLHDRLATARYFTKLDLYSGYHQIPIRRGDEHKTAFTSRYGTYEFLVMPFGLTNAPSTFQTAMHALLYKWLDDFVIVYLDDILIYSPTIEKHYDHVNLVITALHKDKWYCKLSKCDFATTRVEYLGHFIENGTIAIDKTKMDAIIKWQTPMKNLKEVQSFLGLLGYYRKFIPHFSHLAKPLHAFARKDKKFIWEPEHTDAINKLKDAITDPQCLALFDPSRKTILTTDACDYAIGAALSQVYDNGERPIAFISKLLVNAELNYSMWEKELLAVVWAVKELRPYLRTKHFTLFSDNMPSINLLTCKNLKVSTTASNRIIRWLITLQSFNFTPIHRDGKSNVVADALSRFPIYNNVAPSTTEAAIFCHRTCISHPTTNLQPEFETAYSKSAAATALLQQLKDQTSFHPRFTLVNDLILTRETPPRIYLPNDTTLRKRVFQEIHDTPLAGHPGFHRMLSYVKRHFAGPNIYTDVLDYVRTCPECQKAKPRNARPFGTILPLQPPEASWQDISMDLITSLPTSNTFDAIFVIVDRFSKMAHFIPTNTTADAPTLASLFITNIVRIHGIPRSIISDRDPRFVSTFWRELFEQLQTTLRFSTANHPQTDGQTERTNRTLKQYIQLFANHKPNEWHNYIALAEIAYNSSTHSATGFSPFFIVYNQHPYLPLDFLPPVIETRNDASSQLLNDQRTILETTHQNLLRARDNMQKSAPQRKPSNLNVGDLVLVHKTAFRTFSMAPPTVFDDRWYGPFKIIAIINPNAYRIELPPQFKSHNVINISFLHPYKQSSKFPRTHHDSLRPAPAPDDEIDRDRDDPDQEPEPEYEVESIIKHRLTTHRSTRISVREQLLRSTNPDDYEFLIKWKGYPSYESTWEPFQNLTHMPDVLRQYLTSQGLPTSWLDQYPRDTPPVAQTT